MSLQALFCFQKFEFDLAGRILTKSDEIIVSIFDWERVGRNR